MRRLLLVRHAPTSATRSRAFPADEPLDARGRLAAAAFGVGGSARYATMSSPAVRCLQTADAAGLDGVDVVAQLAECDFGGWAGRTLADVHAADPEGALAWMTDPTASPHGGESLVSFQSRVSAWLDGQAELSGTAVAITHGGVVRAAVVCALGAPLEAFWRVDAAPLAVTELHGHDGRWTLARLNCSAANRSAGL